MQSTATQKKKTRQYIDQNPVEAFRDLGQGVASSVKQDVFQGSASALWEQLLGGVKNSESGDFSGDLTPGEELDLRQIQEEQEAEDSNIRLPELPAIDHYREIRTGEVKVAQENQAELEGKIAQILVELKKLVHTSQELEVTYKQVSIETVSNKAGRYHLNFVEWMLSMIRTARLKVDESKSWMTALYQKRAKRGYWNMFKKHGTTFGLSQERTTATQTG